MHLFCCICCALRDFPQSTALNNIISLKSHFFSPIPKNLFQENVIFGFRQFPLQPQFYNVSWFWLFWPLDKTDSVHEHAVFVSLPNTNRVWQLCKNNPHFQICSLSWQPLKTLSWEASFSNFLFCVFIIFCLTFPNIGKAKTKPFCVIIIISVWLFPT